MADSPDPHALARDLRVVIGQMRRRLREQAQTAWVTSSEMVALGHIERGGPATISALARAEGVRPQSMGATIATLQAAGYVEASPHPTDGRQTVISLTEECRDWLAAMRAAREDWLHAALDAHLTPAEQARLAEAVTLLKRLVEAP